MTEKEQEIQELEQLIQKLLAEAIRKQNELAELLERIKKEQGRKDHLIDME